MKVILKKAKTFSFLRWLLLLPIPVLWAWLDFEGQLTLWENRSVDWRFRYRGELESAVKLVYVDVDSLSQANIGNHPWTRNVYAKVAAALVNESKVKAVGFDFVFSDAGISQSADERRIAQGNRVFQSFLNQSPPVVLAAAYGGWKFIDINGAQRERHIRVFSNLEDKRTPEEVELPEIPYFLELDEKGKKRFSTPAVDVGLIDTIDNGTRMVPAWVPNLSGRVYYHLAVELARIYWGLPANALRVREGVLEFMRADGSVHASIPLIDGQLLEVNWFNQWGEEGAVAKLATRPSRVEFAEVLQAAINLESKDQAKMQEAKEFFSDPELKDAVVLIGPVDPLLQDLAPTSFDDNPVPKVGLHGNLLRTIVSGLTLRRLAPWQNQLIVFGLTVLVLTLSVAGGARAVFAKIMAVLCLALYIAGTFWYFEQIHLVLPFVAPIGAAFTTGFGGLIIQVLDEQKARARVTGMFGTYVSPQLVEQMVKSGEEPQLGGHDQEITAYFSDIQSFSKFSELLGSKKLVELLNEYLTACTDIVQEQAGTLDKYIGDAVVAMYGAPIVHKDHAFRACVASQLVHQKLSELRTKWQSEGEKWPEIVWNMQTRIGLNTGLCTIGNMGSLGTATTKARFNYTMMGDNVNLAARMESGAKSWGVYTMVTEETRRQALELGGDRVVFRPLGRIQVMGREQAVPIHEVVGLKEHVPSSVHECIGLFSEGLEKLYARDWDGAIARFEKSRELEPNQPGRRGVKTNPSRVLMEHCAEYKLEAPPEKWDGRYVMKEK